MFFVDTVKYVDHQTPMETFKDITDRLAKYCGYEVSEDASSLSISCNGMNSFVVSIHDLNGEYVVYYDGWHNNFDDRQDALNCFAYAFSDQCRLQVTLRGQLETKWTLQTLEDGRWVNDSTVGLLLVPFWRPAEIVIRQNRLELKQ